MINQKKYIYKIILVTFISVFSQYGIVFEFSYLNNDQLLFMNTLLFFISLYGLSKLKIGVEIYVFLFVFFLYYNLSMFVMLYSDLYGADTKLELMIERGLYIYLLSYILLISLFFVFKIPSLYIGDYVDVNLNKIRFKVMMYLIIIIVPLSIIVMLKSGNMYLGATNYDADRITNRQGLGVFNLIMTMFLPWLFAMILIKFKELKLLHLIVLIFFALLTFMVTGHRSSIVGLVLIYLFVYYKYGYFHLTSILFFMLSLFLLGSILGYLRSGNEVDLAILLNILTYGFMGSFGDILPYLEIVNHSIEKVDYSYFYYLKDAIVKSIPRVFYPEKPLIFGVSGYIAEHIFGSSLHSRVPGILGEGFFYFGLLGITSLFGFTIIIFKYISIFVQSSNLNIQSIGVSHIGIYIGINRGAYDVLINGFIMTFFAFLVLETITRIIYEISVRRHF